MSRAIRSPGLVITALLLAAACGSDSGAGEPGAGTTDPSGTQGSPETSGAVPSDPVASRCLVRLHGKGGVGGDTAVVDGVSVIAPTGNADGWGARQWLYFPEDQYGAARQVVADAIGSCELVIVDGFSNGGAFAAKLYCRGETFDGRLVRVVVDDPVVDNGVSGCAPDPTVDVALYWTGGLDATATPGWDCAEGDWTCEDGETIGIDAYAAALGTDVLESPFEDHQWYLDAPELSDW